MNSTTRFATLAALAGALACASNKARTEDTTQPSQAAAARDTTTTDTTNQNPAGYRGMERDTSMAPEHQQTPTDTFLQRQGTGAPQDTAGYSGMERVDTTGQAGQNQNQANPPSEVTPTDTTGAAAGVRQDTSGVTGQDTSGMSRQDTSGMRDTSGMSGMDTTSMQHDTSGYQNNSGTGLDSTGTSRTGDTTGYKQSQDTTTSR